VTYAVSSMALLSPIDEPSLPPRADRLAAFRAENSIAQGDPIPEVRSLSPDRFQPVVPARLQPVSIPQKEPTNMDIFSGRLAPYPAAKRLSNTSPR
jgi:hypothetical protein